MVDRIGPVNAVKVGGVDTPQFDGRWERQLRGVHQAMGSTARPLGVRTGVRPGTSPSTVTATSTTWTCQPFAGDADVESAAEAGAYPFSFDAVVTGAMTPANGTNPRKDIIYVQIDDPSEDGSSQPAVTRKYLAGTAAGTPSAPALPVTRGFVVAEINVPKSGAGSPSVTWVAPYTASAGGVVEFNKRFEMDAWTTAAPGQRAHVIETDAEYRRAGSAWLPAGGNMAGGKLIRAFNAPGAPQFGAGWTVLNNPYWTVEQPLIDCSQTNGVFTGMPSGMYEVDVALMLDASVVATVIVKKNDLTASAAGSQGGDTCGAGPSSFTQAGARARVRITSPTDTIVAALLLGSGSIPWSNDKLSSSYLSVRYVEPLR